MYLMNELKMFISKHTRAIKPQNVIIKSIPRIGDMIIDRIAIV